MSGGRRQVVDSTEKDLNVTVQGNQLYIPGERVLDLPAGLDVEKLEAHLHDGLLDVRIPLASAMKPKQIRISTPGETAKQIAA